MISRGDVWNKNKGRLSKNEEEVFLLLCFLKFSRRADHFHLDKNKKKRQYKMLFRMLL